MVKSLLAGAVLAFGVVLGGPVDGAAVSNDSMKWSDHMEARDFSAYDKYFEYNKRDAVIPAANRGGFESVEARSSNAVLAAAGAPAAANGVFRISHGGITDLSQLPFDLVGYEGIDGLDGIDFEIIDEIDGNDSCPTNQVPEPGLFLILGAGMLMLYWQARKGWLF